MQHRIFGTSFVTMNSFLLADFKSSTVCMASSAVSKSDLILALQHELQTSRSMLETAVSLLRECAEHGTSACRAAVQVLDDSEAFCRRAICDSCQSSFEMITREAVISFSSAQAAAHASSSYLASCQVLHECVAELHDHGVTLLREACDDSAEQMVHDAHIVNQLKAELRVERFRAAQRQEMLRHFQREMHHASSATTVQALEYVSVAQEVQFGHHRALLSALVEALLALQGGRSFDPMEYSDVWLDRWLTELEGAVRLPVAIGERPSDRGERNDAPETALERLTWMSP